VITAARHHLPNTALHVLSNGRRFADRDIAMSLAGIAPDAVTWGIPVYGDVAALHDYVVQARGAFSETIEGLYNLASIGAVAEIRIVLTRPTVERLEALSRFIYRALPFAAHVAFMGLEPMGFARRNRDAIWIDPADFATPLGRAVHRLAAHGMTVSLYNLPLCVLPADLHRFARASISDWKNDFAPVCAPCPARAACAGFFVSADARWIGRDVRPLTDWPAPRDGADISCPA
jgi:His-Xaa-Ser system radical SAM maturase HxsC